MALLAADFSHPLQAGPSETSTVERTMRARFPAVAPVLSARSTSHAATVTVAGRTVSGFAVEPAEATPPVGLGPEEDRAWRDRTRRWKPFFPGSFDEPFVFEGEGVRVGVRPLGAASASADDSGGKVVYPGGYADTDVLYVTGQGRTEEFMLLHSTRAPVRFEYEILDAAGTSKILLRNGAVFFPGAGDQGLVILKPVVVDAEGRRSDSRIAWELGPEMKNGGRRLTLRLDPTGLTYPLLVDPSWTTTGSLNTGRGYPNAVLLQTGKVLILAGSPTTQNTAELYDPATGIWTPTANIPIGRSEATATLLTNGKVLVTGGGTLTGVTADCRLYDPATGSWSATGSMNVGRQDHTATLLPNGRVLVAGGQNPLNNPLGTSELYDPTTGTWSLTTGGMNAPRRSHSATLLATGKVLAAGGVSLPGPSAVNTAEVFDPATGAWTPAINTMSVTHYLHSATLMPNGSVLVTGNEFSPGTTNADIYSPASNSWTATAPIHTGRGDHTASLLPNGTVLVAGGYLFGTGVLASTETYDPASGLWTVQGNLNSARYGHAAIVLWNGKVLVAGGQNASLATAELYDPDLGSWSSTLGTMSAARDEHTATFLPGGKVLVAGGNPPLTGAELYDPASKTWSGTGSLNIGRYRFAATLLANGKVLVEGGENGGPNLTSAEIYDPGTGTWSSTGSMLNQRSFHTATLLPCGEVLVAGGESSSGVLVPVAERYNIGSATWRATGSLNAGRWRHTATLLPNGTVLVTGGWGSSGVLASSELYDPATETWTTTGSMSTGRYYHTATLLPSGKVLVAGEPFIGPGASAELYNPATGTWTTTGAMIQPRHNHTATLLPNGKVLVAGGYQSSTGWLQTSELYDPSTGKWASAGTLTVSREFHSATLLQDGTVLVAGGDNPLKLSSSELYNVGRGETAAWRPVLTTVTSPLNDGSALAAAGSGFKGISEASTGDSSKNSSSNYPLVQLRRLDNEAFRWLSVDPTAGWSDTSFTSAAQSGLTCGYALATVFTNGIPSISRSVAVQCTPAAAITAQPSSQSLCQGATATLGVGATGTCIGYVWQKGGTALSDGGHLSGTRTPTLTVSPVDGTDAGSYAAVVTSSCNATPAVSAAATLSFSLLPPSFGGLGSVSPIGGTCGFRLAWSGATTSCSSAPTVRYNVYRSTTPGFTPGPFTLLATCVANNFFNDTAGISSGTTYYYAVRAEDSSTNFGGACNGGASDANGTELPGLISGTCTVTNAPSAVPVFTVRATSLQNQLEWLNPSTGPYGSTRILFRTDTFPTSPTDGTLLTERFGLPGAHDMVTHGGLVNGTTYYYAAFVNNGSGTLSASRVASGRPFDTSGPVKWAFTTGASTLAPPGVGPAAFADSNDRILHGMVRGTLGGSWPAGWTPPILNGPAQSRPPVVPTSAIPGASRVVFLGSQDGHVYAINADTGASLWASPPLGDMVQAAVAGMFKVYGGGFDYLLIGTRNATASSVFYALNATDGTVVGSFDNAPTGIGIINGGAAVDYASSRVYFASRARAAGGNTLWALDISATGVAFAWGQNFPGDPNPDIDGSPVLRNGRVYVGTNSGRVYSLDAVDGSIQWTFDTADGPIKSFIFPDRLGTSLYLSTTTTVWGLTDGNATPNWPPVTTIPSPSNPLFTTGGTLLFVGASDGQLYQLDLSAANATTPPVVKSVLLGPGAANVGSPTLDTANGMVYVGTDAGIVDAVQVPLP